MVSLQDAASIIHSMSPRLLPDTEAEEDEEVEEDKIQVCPSIGGMTSSPCNVLL